MVKLIHVTSKNLKVAYKISNKLYANSTQYVRGQEVCSSDPVY